MLKRLQGLAKEDSLIRKARDFGAEAHLHQYCHSGMPLFNHPLMVASKLVYTGDATLIAASLLHEVMEHTTHSYETISKSLDENVAFLVDSVSKRSKKLFKNRQDRLEEFHSRFFDAVDIDKRIGFLRLADRFLSLQDLHVFNIEKQLRIARETLDIYCPLAFSLNISYAEDMRSLAKSYLEEKSCIAN